MEVFIPALKDANPFFDEIMLHSKCDFIFDDFKKYQTHYKTVLIHWPEQLFGWKEPTETDLQELKVAINLWKGNSKIIYVVHNLERHYGMTLQFTKLYNLIAECCDEMIHFGEFSKELMQKKYPLKKHTIIFHPLYKNSFKIYEKEYARKALGIRKNAFVILVPGAFRNNEEVNMIFNAFENIKVKGKVLLVTRMKKKVYNYNFKGRVFFKKYLKIDFKKIHEQYLDYKFKKKGFYFNYHFLDAEHLSLMLSATDIVFIPRIQILNSGNVFLAMTYQKIMIAAERGNIKEVLEKLRMPLFNPENPSSVANSLMEAIELYKSGTYKYNSTILNEYDPAVLAQQWDAVLSN